MATSKGRSVKPDLSVGICGEHGGEPKSVAFATGLDSTTCHVHHSVYLSPASPRLTQPWSNPDGQPSRHKSAIAPMCSLCLKRVSGTRLRKPRRRRSTPRKRIGLPSRCNRRSFRALSVGHERHLTSRGEVARSLASTSAPIASSLNAIRARRAPGDHTKSEVTLAQCTSLEREGEGRLGLRPEPQTIASTI